MCADLADICTRTWLTWHRKEEGKARRQHWKACLEGRKVEKETISGKGKNISQWVGCRESVGKCRREKLSDETPFEEEQNPKRNAMLLTFLFFDVKTTPKIFNMLSS